MHSPVRLPVRLVRLSPAWPWVLMLMRLPALAVVRCQERFQVRLPVLSAMRRKVRCKVRLHVTLHTLALPMSIAMSKLAAPQSLPG